MTLQELSALHDLNQEIDMDRRRLLELEAEPGMEDEVREVREIIRKKQRRNMRERAKLEKWIAGIPDSLTRQVFTLRFVHDQTWVQVAVAVGGGNTEDSVRKLAKRYAARQR